MAASHQLSCSLGRRDTRNSRTNVFLALFDVVRGRYQGINDSNSDSHVVEGDAGPRFIHADSCSTGACDTLIIPHRAGAAWNARAAW